MDDKDSAIEVSGQAGGNAVPGRADCKSPTAPPLLDLNEDEMRVFDYICRSLREAGVEHLTAGMPIAVIVRTYADWITAYVECETKGRYQTAQSGWASPTPWATDEQRLKMELGQWLPKACLTIPALTRVRKDTGQQGGQDDLFADLVAHATSSPGRKLQS